MAYGCSLTPMVLQISDGVTPASACLRAHMICSSVYLFRFIFISPLGGYLKRILTHAVVQFSG